MIYIIRERVTAEQINEMLEMLQTYIKLAVDIDRGILAGGGVMHADCEAVLLEDGGQQEYIWGADWILHSASNIRIADQYSSSTAKSVHGDS